MYICTSIYKYRCKASSTQGVATALNWVLNWVVAERTETGNETAWPGKKKKNLPERFGMVREQDMHGLNWVVADSGECRRIPVSTE